MAVTCPRCGQASGSPDDEREGYCGACRDWTGADGGSASRGLWQYIGRTDSELWYADVGLDLDEAVTALITGSQRNPVADCGDYPGTAAERQPEVDDMPWSDPMEWSPGDAEL